MKRYPLLATYDSTSKSMMFEHWCVFLGLVTLVAGGVVKMPEEIPADIAADHTYLYDFAANPALLSDEELKIVALLEMIESKFGTLQENEKDEVSCSISLFWFYLNV